MLVFRGSRFQYSSSVSLQEGLGRVGLKRWILEEMEEGGFRQSDVATASILQRSVA